MLVSKDDFPLIIGKLKALSLLAADAETLGLRMFHGEIAFSIIIAGEIDGSIQGFYFNFNHDTNSFLSAIELAALKELFEDPTKKWYFHNAKFDMHQLSQTWGIEVAGEIICTQALGRVEHNDHIQYSLDASLKRIGLTKDAAVEKYIKEHKLTEKIAIDGKKDFYDKKFYNKVPLDIIVPYGVSDAVGTYKLGMHLEKSLIEKAKAFPPGVPTVLNIAEMEKTLTKVVYKMEKHGVKIDREYCKRAAAYENDRRIKLGNRFEELTGRTYSASPKLFSEVFASDKDKWTYTPKGNPSFGGDTLKFFSSEAAKTVVEMREAKSKSDFYCGFLWHADSDDIIHPNFHPGGTATGRFSSSDPNLQNLTSEDEEDQLAQEFVVRRAIIPRPGYIFGGFDFKQMEYRVMLDFAKHAQIDDFTNRKVSSWGKEYFKAADDVAAGMDVHQAVADMAKITRRQAKTLNFALLYGAGVNKIALMLGVPYEEANRLRAQYFLALPYVESMIAQITYTARKRKWIRNFAGRRYECEDPNFAYSKTNYIIQGSCADVNKRTLVAIDQRLAGTNSNLVLSIHDEDIIEFKEGEEHMLKELAELAASQYPHKYIPMGCDTFMSNKSLADWQ